MDSACRVSKYKHMTMGDYELEQKRLNKLWDEVMSDEDTDVFT